MAFCMDSSSPVLQNALKAELFLLGNLLMDEDRLQFTTNSLKQT